MQMHAFCSSLGEDVVEGALLQVGEVALVVDEVSLQPVRHLALRVHVDDLDGNTSSSSDLDKNLHCTEATL